MKLNRRSLLKTFRRQRGTRGDGPAIASPAIDELVIAYNVNLPSWDPTVGPSRR